MMVLRKTTIIILYYYPQFIGHLVKISPYPLIPERKHGVSRYHLPFKENNVMVKVSSNRPGHSTYDSLYIFITIIFFINEDL